MAEQKKALLVTTVSGFVPQFEMQNVRILQELGYEVHYAANYRTPSYGTDNHRLDGTGIIRHQIDFERSPFHPANIRVYRELCRLMRRERFALVHCHTPVGGVMARLAAHATRTGPVVYTAHGFHFYQGAPLKNWLCYYPVEKFLSRYTDEQICINREDYQLALRKFHAGHVTYTPGVGLDLSRIPEENQALREQKRRELGVGDHETVLLSSGELIPRKNHETVIRAMAELLRMAGAGKAELPRFHYYICGHGKLQGYLTELIRKLELSEYVTLLGYRTDMMELYQAADLFLFPSWQEGLPMALLEAMANGLPVICSDIRGSRDLMGAVLKDSASYGYCRGGILVKKPGSAPDYAASLYRLMSCSRDRLDRAGQENRKRAKEFAIEKVSEVMRGVYRKYPYRIEKFDK